MKKLSVIVAMALAAVVNYSCGEYDNAVDLTKTVFVDNDGQKRPVDLDVMLYGTPNETVSQLKMVLSKDKDTIFVKSGDEKPVMLAADENNTVDFKDVVIGENGIVMIYSSKGSDILSLTINGDATPVAYDQAKLLNIEDITIKNATIDAISLPALEKLTKFYLSDCIGVNALDVTEATALEELKVEYTKDSKLTSVDLSKNTALKVLSFRQKNEEHKIGVLTALDLSNNTNLETVDARYNNISSVVLSDNYENLASLDLRANNLPEFILNGSFPALKTLHVGMNPQLYKIDVTAAPALESLNVANDSLTLATLPLNATTYANQAAMPVTLNDNILDLTSQLYVDGTETEYDLGELVEGYDYILLEPGVFKFIKKLDNFVIGMRNAKFPKFNTNPFKTQPFSTNEPSNDVFTWGYVGTTEFIEGGTLSVVPVETENDPLSHKIGLWKNQYATILIDGTQETLSKKFNYIRVNLQEPLKEGMKIIFTGFLYTNKPDVSANLYLLFALPNYVNCKSYPDYLPNDVDNTGYKSTTLGYGVPHVFNNTYNGAKISTSEPLIVDKSLEGVKSFKIVREIAETPIYLTKISIVRQ